MQALIDVSPAGLEQLIAIWIDAKYSRSRSAKTVSAYTSTMQSFRAELMRHGLDLLSDARLVGLVAQGWAAQHEAAPATISQRLAILSSFYTFIHRRNLLPCENPIAVLDRPPIEAYAQAEPLDAAYIRQRLAAIDRSELAGKRDYALLAVLLTTGRRLSEVAGLRWGCVSSGGDGAITLAFEHAKGDKRHRDTLADPIGRALVAWLTAFYSDLAALDPEAPIWVNLSKTTSRSTYGARLGIRSVATICEQRLGVSKVHALRHTFASELEDAGAKVSEIRDRLGHTSIATTSVYLSKLKRDRNPYAGELARRFGLDGAAD
jgi:site-specific recombinase XerD